MALGNPAGAVYLTLGLLMKDTSRASSVLSVGTHVPDPLATIEGFQRGITR